MLHLRVQQLPLRVQQLPSQVHQLPLRVQQLPSQVHQLPSWVHRVIDTCVLPYRTRFTMKHCAVGYPHVALLFKGRKLLAIGQNRIFRRGPYSMIHAECDAIRSIGLSQLRDATLVVVRLGPTSLLYSKPCRTCSFYIKKCMREYGLRNCLHS